MNILHRCNHISLQGQHLVTIVHLSSSGKEFVPKVTRLLMAFVQKSSLEPIAMQAMMTMPALLLQKPHRGSKAKNHIHCLETWMARRINELVQGQVIQKHLPTALKMGVDKFNSTFARLIFGGNIKAVLHLLANYEDSGGGVLPLSAMIDGEKSVQDVLKMKTPNRKNITS